MTPPHTHTRAQAAKRQAVAELVVQLEALNPLEAPTQHLEQVAGDWRLLYTTITITVSAMAEMPCMHGCIYLGLQYWLVCMHCCRAVPPAMGFKPAAPLPLSTSTWLSLSRYHGMPSRRLTYWAHNTMLASSLVRVHSHYSLCALCRAPRRRGWVCVSL